MMDILSKHSNSISNYCKTNKIKKLALFGSYLTNSFNEASDIDLLVEFEEDCDYGFLDIARIERELSEILGTQVDLRTPNGLSKYFREMVVREAKVKYEV